MSTHDSAIAVSEARFRTLGVCWIAYGIARLLMAFWLLGVSGTATVMFGALLQRVPDPFTLMHVFHFVYAANIVLSAVCGLLGLLAGLALLASKQFARTLALIAGFLALTNVPFGTTLGIYTLVILFSSRPIQTESRSVKSVN